MFTQFRTRYPKGSLVTELLTIDHGKYIVRCWIQVEGITLATGLAAAQTVELAEDEARSRAMAVLGIDGIKNATHQETHLSTSEIAVPPQPAPPTPGEFSPKSPRKTKKTKSSEATKTSTTNGVSPSNSGLEDASYQDVTAPVTSEEKSFRDEEYSSTEVEVSQKLETSFPTPEQIIPSQLEETQTDSYSHDAVEAENPGEDTTSSTPIDFSDIIARTNVELRRLGWTNQQGRDYLLQTYGKRSRQLLTDEELLDFLHNLESLEPELTPD
ncbi:hypothetical protein [Lyngbya aestuarii]|uniref:hypothetical protein n=1 Tax=Lyngbya aestuarii TaxID=118322 RepID=UPI00403DA266